MKTFDAKQVKDQVVQWIKDWFEVNGKGCNAVIGISGGKDSSIVAGLCVEALGKENIATVQAEVTMIPQNYVAVTDPENVKYLQRILDLLDEDDDVQNVYHNWDEPEE